MPYPQVINTLQEKADRLNGYIGKLEADLSQARVDLSHVHATMRLFETPQNGDYEFKSYMNMDRLFKRRELANICKEALEANGPMDTRQLALHVIQVKGFNEDDRHLRTTIAYRIVQALRLQEKRAGAIKRIEKRSNVVVWNLASGCVHK